MASLARAPAVSTSGNQQQYAMAASANRLPVMAPQVRSISSDQRRPNPY